MQPLGPPEKVALYQKISAHGTGGGCGNMLRTGCRKPRKAARVFCSCRAIVPVGIHERLVPTDPCSCEAVKPVSVPVVPTGMGIEETVVQVVSK